MVLQHHALMCSAQKLIISKKPLPYFTIYVPILKILLSNDFHVLHYLAPSIGAPPFLPSLSLSLSLFHTHTHTHTSVVRLIGVTIKSQFYKVTIIELVS